MTSSELQQMAMLCLRRALPITVACVLAMLSLLPIGGFAVAAGPMIVLSVMVWWMLIRPDDIRPWSMFCAGLVVDAFGGGPLGLWSASFTVAYIVVRLQGVELPAMPRLFVLLAYAVVAAMTATTAWSIALVYVGGMIDPRPLMLGVAVSTGVFLVALATGGPRAAAPGRLTGRG